MVLACGLPGLAIPAASTIMNKNYDFEILTAACILLAVLVTGARFLA